MLANEETIFLTGNHPGTDASFEGSYFRLDMSEVQHTSISQLLHANPCCLTQAANDVLAKPLWSQVIEVFKLSSDLPDWTWGWLDMASISGTTARVVLFTCQQLIIWAKRTSYWNSNRTPQRLSDILDGIGILLLPCNNMQHNI